MTQIDRTSLASVPNLDARGRLASARGASWSARLAAGGPITLVVAGLVVTTLWAAFLGWCVVAAVRWALG